MSWALLSVLFPVAVVAAGWLVVRFYLQGEDLSRFDLPRDAPVAPDRDASPQHHVVVAGLANTFGMPSSGSRKERLATLRRQLDALSAAADLNDIRIVPTNANGVPAEWVLAPGSDPQRRLLYIHGGGFTMGSPKSHRVITTKLARIANAAVLAIDYRLMPENARLLGVEDCRKAYRWITARGPAGESPADRVFVAGDSAGGNLTLMLIAWARDAGERVPDAAVALSPSSDSTFMSPSMLRNVPTDPMLGPAFAAALRFRPLVLLANWAMSRVRPNDPIVSPIFGDLSGLPRLLIHASEAEMLIDDARRYANKARRAGSPVTLQTWNHMVHVWHMFEPTLPEAKEAFERIDTFLRTDRHESAGREPARARA